MLLNMAITLTCFLEEIPNIGPHKSAMAPPVYFQHIPVDEKKSVRRKKCLSIR